MNMSDPLFPNCVDSLKKASKDGIELIIVDNGSDQQSFELLKKLKPERLICDGINHGVAGAFNIGASLAKGEILIFVTHDVILHSDCIDYIVETSVSNPLYGAIGCKLLYPDNLHIQHAGAYLKYPRCIGYHYGRFEEDQGQYDKPMLVDYVTGAVFGVPKKLWEKVDGFDERFYPAYYEDSDFCFRLNQMGYKSFYQPKAIAIHGENSSTKTNSKTRLRYLHQNRFRFVLKHLKKDDVIDKFLPEEITAFTLIEDDIERDVLREIYQSGSDIFLTSLIDKKREIIELLTRLRNAISD